MSKKQAACEVLLHVNSVWQMARNEVGMSNKMLFNKITFKHQMSILALFKGDSCWGAANFSQNIVTRAIFCNYAHTFAHSMHSSPFPAPLSCPNFCYGGTTEL